VLDISTFLEEMREGANEVDGYFLGFAMASNTELSTSIYLHRLKR